MLKSGPGGTIVISHQVAPSRRNLLRRLRRAQKKLRELTQAWREANKTRGEADVRVEANSIRAGAATQKALDAMRACYVRMRQLEEELGLEPSDTPAPRHYYYP